MNILSLFDGMSCSQLALNKAEIRYNNFYASEIDKFAIQVTQKNYPNTIQLGDIRSVKAENIGEIDLMLGGSPCQGFSRAGKGLNFKDPRSVLFFEFVRLLAEVKPRYFLFENVKMKKEWQHIITCFLDEVPVDINSSIVSAQNRVRTYWTNLPIKKIIDEGINLIDIFDYHTQSEWEKKMQVKLGSKDFKTPYIKIDRKGNLKKSQNKASCVCGGHRGDGNHSDMDLIMLQNGTVRRYSPIECERLQTVPDNYTDCVSNTQRYKMLGNGWTVNVIAQLLSTYKHADPKVEHDYEAAQEILEKIYC